MRAGSEPEAVVVMHEGGSLYLDVPVHLALEVQISQTL